MREHGSRILISKKWPDGTQDSRVVTVGRKPCLPNFSGISMKVTRCLEGVDVTYRPRHIQVIDETTDNGILESGGQVFVRLFPGEGFTFKRLRGGIIHEIEALSDDSLEPVDVLA